MIWSSHEWKTYLRRLLRDLRRKIKEPNDEVPFLVERNIFIIVFAIRKLIDSGKTTDALSSVEFELGIHRKIGSKHHDQRYHTVDPEYWDLLSSTESKFKIRDICNEIIHSDVLTWIVDCDTGLEGFFVASDLNAPKRLIKIDFSTFFQMIDLVLADHVVSIEISYDHTGKIKKRLLG